jgi:hypothetical protein
VIVELAIPVLPRHVPGPAGAQGEHGSNTGWRPSVGVVGISHWRTGAVAAVVTRVITTISANSVGADDSEVEADVQDDPFHEPSGIHQCAERGRVAPTQPGEPGSDVAWRHRAAAWAHGRDCGVGDTCLPRHGLLADAPLVDQETQHVAGAHVRERRSAVSHATSRIRVSR